LDSRVASLEGTIQRPNKDYNYYKVVAATYSIGINDHVVGVDYTSTAPVTLTLPLISSAGKIKLIIKDEGYGSAANKITINRSGSDTIGDGETQIILKKNGIAISLYNDGTSKWFIYGGA
jgi:hypothetical protein